MDNEVKKNWKMLIGLSILVLGLTYGVQMIDQSQENRSKATSESENEVTEINNLCGSSNGLSVLSRPIEGLCNQGSAIWIDSVASEGFYRWKCMDEISGENSECNAVIESFKDILRQ